MSITRAEVDSFHRFALERLSAPGSPRTMEECFLRWRAETPAPPVGPPTDLPPHLAKLRDLEPFPNGETVKDRLEALGILGSSEGGPPDLSTNPKYMEGFGLSQADAGDAAP